MCSNYCYFLLPSFQNFTNSTKREGWEVIQHLSCFVFYSHAFILCNILSIFFSLFDFFLFFCGDNIAIKNEKNLMSCIQIISNYGLVLFHFFLCLIWVFHEASDVFNGRERFKSVTFVWSQYVWKGIVLKWIEKKFLIRVWVVAFFFYAWNSLATVNWIRILIHFF